MKFSIGELTILLKGLEQLGENDYNDNLQRRINKEIEKLKEYEKFKKTDFYIGIWEMDHPGIPK